MPQRRTPAMTDRTARPYDGIRVIDLTHELGSYATRLFADLGAEVIRVDLPGGTGLPGGAGRGTPALPGLGGDVRFAFINANKKSVAIDYRAPDGRETLAGLVATAQIVAIEAGAGGVPDDIVALAMGVPGGRVVTVFSHFGLDGPYAGFIGSDLVTQSLGGITWMSGVPGEPPLRLAGEQAGFVTSLYAATAMAIALRDVEANGGSHVLDVSAQECIAHSLQNALQVYDLEQRSPVRGGEGTRDATEQIFACKDGFVFLASAPSMPAAWAALLAWMDEEGFPGAERLRTPDWSNRQKRTTAAMGAEFRAVFEAFASTKTMGQMRTEALRRRIIMAPVSRIGDLEADPQLVFRRFFHDVSHPAAGRTVRFPGAPFRLSEPVWRIDRPAPQPGEHTGEVLGHALPLPATG